MRDSETSNNFFSATVTLFQFLDLPVQDLDHQTALEKNSGLRDVLSH